MASLTHVCIWSDNNWKPISAEEAARLHPGGTVSARSGLFMCELCGQYVTLVDGERMVRHFRHSAAEKSKNCPERTFGSGYVAHYKANEFDLPLRIVDISKTDFRFELGLIRIPDELFSTDIHIYISASDDLRYQYTYTGERLNQGTITYLNIGDAPHSAYKLTINGCSDRITQFWPKSVSGIDPQGTFFEKSSGRKLENDSDVVVGKTYYLLTRRFVAGKRNHVKVEEVCKKRVSFATWTVYQVEALDYDEASARFFLDYHCRLTEQPIEIHPIWPVSVQDPYVVKHRDDRLTLFFRGNATAYVFPAATTKCFRNSTVLEVQCNSRQQLISAGRVRALQYKYFWEDPLCFPSPEPQLSVSDIFGVAIEPGMIYQLPPEKTLCISAAVDGYAEIRAGATIIEKRRLKAKTSVELSNLRFGQTVSIIIGCDRIAEFSFAEIKAESKVAGESLLNELKNAGGAFIPIPHSLGGIEARLKDCPRLTSWLYERIREGKMREVAFRKLQKFILDSDSTK